MPKKLTKETAKEIIENKLKKETPYILFIGFEDNVWLGNRKTKIILKCTKHNIISSILYKSEDFYFDIISSCVRSENIQRNFYIYFNNNKFIKVDFFIKKLNCIIEFDGIQHYEFVPFLQKTYSKFINQVNRDRCLEQYCKENNICLLRIPYKDNNRIPEIIKIFFEEGKDITTKVEPKLLPVLYYG